MAAGEPVGKQHPELGWTAVFLAAREGHAETVRALTELGADPFEDIDRWGIANGSWEPMYEMSAFWVAVMRGHRAVVEHCVSLRPSVPLQAPLEDEGGMSAWLGYAAVGALGRLEEALASGGVDLEAMTDIGQTALVLGAQGGHAAVVSLLVGHGASVRPGPAADGRSRAWPAVEAAMGGHAEVLAVLRDAGSTLRDYGEVASKPPIVAASKHGHADALRELLLYDESAELIDLPDTAGNTALFMACWHGHPDMAGLLLAAGASPRTMTSMGSAPLHVTCDTSQSLRLLDQLVSADPGCIDVRSRHDWTALHMAALHGWADGVRALLGYGASIEVSTSAGQTPLHMAAGSAHEGAGACVDVLLEAGADVLARDAAGGAPVEAAARSGLALSFRRLVERGGLVPEDEPYAMGAANKSGEEARTAMVWGELSWRRRGGLVSWRRSWQEAEE